MRAAAAALALAALAAAACERERSVQIRFGSGDGTLGLGFRCKDDAGTLLFARALVGSQLRFSVVFDLIGIGDTVPGCRAEEIAAACPRAADCPALVVSADGRRACMELVIDPPFATPLDVLPRVLAALDGFEITDDAPAQPVIVRAVATTERCEPRLVEPQGDTYPLLDPARALGCGYSCPLQLDTVEGSVALYLDALDDRCEAQVRACAAFPDRGE